MAAWLNLSDSGMKRLLASPQLEAGVVAHAQRLKAIAEATSPVGTPPDDEHPGLYQRSWHLDVGRWRTLSRDYGPHMRVQVTVYNNARYAYALEFGTKYATAQHVLQKAVDIAVAS